MPEPQSCCRGRPAVTWRGSSAARVKPGRDRRRRVGETASPRGAKTELVHDAVRAQPAEFRVVDIERACPGVGRDWIRALLAEMKKKGEVTCQGRGPAARWRWIGGKGSTLK